MDRRSGHTAQASRLLLLCSFQLLAEPILLSFLKLLSTAVTSHTTNSVTLFALHNLMGLALGSLDESHRTYVMD